MIATIAINLSSFNSKDWGIECAEVHEIMNVETQTENLMALSGCKMSVDTASAKILCAAKSMGVDFDRTAMLGHQHFLPSRIALEKVFAALNISEDAKSFIDKHVFADEFLGLLGANRVDSIDYSTYEGASIIHNLNEPLPSDLRQQFSAVFDGGTLEHVFDVPRA